MDKIVLLPLHIKDPNLTEFLAYTLSESLERMCVIEKAHIDLEPFLKLERGQYHSTPVLSEILKHPHEPHEKILGLVEVDLCIPILTFVFGEAQLNGSAAIVSTHRLYQEFYGLPKDKKLFYERCEKEALHELGHTFGLIHCPNFECVMHYGNSVDDIDMKKNRFCEVCQAVFFTR